jgi:hypothetical protein
MVSMCFQGVIINIIMLIMALNGTFDRRGHYLMIEKRVYTGTLLILYGYSYSPASTCFKLK